MREVVLYIAMSLDGFIAKENGDISFLEIVNSPGEDYGYSDFIKTVDTVIMGRKTYEKTLAFDSFPHKERKCYVMSGTRKGKDENVEFYNGNLVDLIKMIRQHEGKNIFVDGGAELVDQMMKLDLIDRYVISVIPVLIGGSVSLFKAGRPEQSIKLIRSEIFPTGLVQLWYERK